jgi:hypothetical protein
MPLPAAVAVVRLEELILDLFVLAQCLFANLPFCQPPLPPMRLFVSQFLFPNCSQRIGGNGGWQNGELVK